MKQVVSRAVAIVLVFAAAQGASVATKAPDIWTVLTIDPEGDRRGDAGPDAAQLAFRYEKATDLLWFRIVVYGRPDANAFGVQIAVDTGEGRAKESWWGANKTFKFDRMVTARVTRHNDAYEGTIGVSDADGTRAGDWTNVSRDALRLRVDEDGYIVGVRRADITAGTKMSLVVAVGSNERWTDEIPTIGQVSIDLSAPRPARGLREIDVSRNNLELPPAQKTLTDDEPPSIVRRGRSTGPAFILVPGVFSPPDTFDAFIARHAADYRFFVLTPPGLSGSRARRMPAVGTSYGERTWTRHLERDILELIRREKLDKPVLMSHGFPGSLALTAIAANHPETVGAAIEIAAMPPRPVPSTRDPSGKTPATPAERVRYQDALWGPKWFKYVTPETWENNNYRALMFQTDLKRAELARQQIERNPLAIKIRYLTEANGADDSTDLARAAVPLLALRPGFSSRVFEDSANAWFRQSFIDAWDAFASNDAIQLTTIPNAGVLVFHDQPDEADAAVVSFLRVRSRRSATAQPPSNSNAVLDVHLHALSANAMGPPPATTCATPQVFLPRDPRDPYGPQQFATCDRLLRSPGTDEELLQQTLAEMSRYNVFAVASGPIDVVRRWHAAAPDRIIPALMPGAQTTPAAIREWAKDGTIRVLGELGFQYSGSSPGDAGPDAYFSLAEELDLPVGVHVGPGAPGAPYVGFPKYEMRLTNPLLYETVLTRHPKLRLYLMHAAWPMLDQMIGLLYAHPQVYVDISLIDWFIPRKEFHFFLRRLVDAGFEKRIMFGSDQTVWPDALRLAIEGVESADFLSPSQKRDIFYNNAVRFLRLEQTAQR